MSEASKLNSFELTLIFMFSLTYRTNKQLKRERKKLSIEIKSVDTCRKRSIIICQNKTKKTSQEVTTNKSVWKQIKFYVNKKKKTETFAILIHSCCMVSVFDYLRSSKRASFRAQMERSLNSSSLDHTLK